MERDIRFRAWDRYSESMHLDVQTGIYEDPDEIIPFGKILDFANYEVMQYIGIKDKNGKEIYEGDIVVFLDWKPKVIEYGTCGFIGYGLKNTMKFLTDYDFKNIEVIGNIYENNYLLV